MGMSRPATPRGGPLPATTGMDMVAVTCLVTASTMTLQVMAPVWAACWYQGRRRGS